MPHLPHWMKKDQYDTVHDEDKGRQELADGVHTTDHSFLNLFHKKKKDHAHDCDDAHAQDHDGDHLDIQTTSSSSKDSTSSDGDATSISSIGQPFLVEHRVHVGFDGVHSKDHSLLNIFHKKKKDHGHDSDLEHAQDHDGDHIDIQTISTSSKESSSSDGDATSISSIGQPFLVEHRVHVGFDGVHSKDHSLRNFFHLKKKNRGHDHSHREKHKDITPSKAISTSPDGDSTTISSIGHPYLVEHKFHVGFDKMTGEFHGLPTEWQLLLNGSNISYVEHFI